MEAGGVGMEADAVVAFFVQISTLICKFGIDAKDHMFKRIMI